MVKEASLLFTEVAIQVGGRGSGPMTASESQLQALRGDKTAPLPLKQCENHFLVLPLNLHGNALPRKKEDSCITSVCARTLMSRWAGT